MNASLHSAVNNQLRKSSLFTDVIRWPVFWRFALRTHESAAVHA